MKMTREDLINYFNEHENSSVYTVCPNGKLRINSVVFFNNVNPIFTELPDNIIFQKACYLGNSPFKYVPHDIVLKSSLSISNSYITEFPPVSVGGNFYISNSIWGVPFGLYIGCKIYSTLCALELHTLHSVDINGYIVCGGVIS